MKHTKRYALLLLAGLLALSLCACGGLNEAAGSVGEAIGQMLSGDVTGEVGKVYRTEWFSFTVESVEVVSSYAGYTPAEGYVLYDTVVTETCTFDQPIPMGTFDFFMDHDSFMDYAYPLDPLNDSMMPLEFELDKGEFATYHMVFEVPEDVESGLRLMYVEVDENDTEHATFTIKVN